MNPEFSLVIPAYNEAQRLPAVLEAARVRAAAGLVNRMLDHRIAD